MEVIAQTTATTKLSKANSTQCNSNDVITSSTNPSSKDNDIQHNNTLSPVVVVPTCKSKKGPYTLGVTLGEGAFAKVKLATHNIIKEKIAIKIIDKFKLLKDETDIHRIKREISILKKIRHNNIIQLYEIMESKHNLYIVMEYCEGKELFDYIVKHKRLNEKDACILFQQLISGVDYLHKQGIIHRDLKPENILLDANNNIKLSDFGLSTFDTHNHLLKTPCGTPTYAPPEMLRGDEYNGECSDIWSCGVILYAMLCGALPYVESKEEVILHKIIHKEFTLPSFLSRQAVDLINKMLTNEPKERIGINGIIRHPWFNIVKPKLYCGLDLNKVQPPVDEHILEKVKLYGYDVDKCRECVMKNKYDTLTAVYYLLVRKHVANGGSSISDLQSKEFVNYVKAKESKNVNVNVNANGNITGSAECGNKNKQIVKCNNNNNQQQQQKHVKKKSIDLAKVTTITNKELRLSNHYVSTKINNNNNQNAPLPLYANSPCSKRVHTKVKSDFTGSFAGSLSNTTHARELHLAKQMLCRKKRQEKIKVNNNHNTNTQSMSHNNKNNNNINNNNNDLQYINRELIGNSFGSFDISVHPITTSIPNNNVVNNNSTNRNSNSNRSSKTNLINHSRFNGNKNIKHSFVMKKEVFIYDTNPHYKHRKSKHKGNNHNNKFLDISTTQLDASIERSTSINKHHSSKSPELRKVISPNKEDPLTSPSVPTRKPINTLNTNCIQIINGTSPTKSNCVSALQKCKNKLKPSTTTSNPANPNTNKKCTISLMKASAPKQTPQHYITNNVNNTKYQTINASSSTSSAGHSKAKTSKKNSFVQKNELSARPQPKRNIVHQGEPNNNEAKSKNDSIEIIFKHTRTGSACDSLSQTKKRIQINFNNHNNNNNNNNICNNNSSHMNTEIVDGLTHVAVVPTPKQSIIDIISVHEPHKSSRNSYGSSNSNSNSNYSSSVHKSFVFPQCKLKVVDINCVFPISKQLCLNVIVNTIYEWLKKEKITHTKFNKTNNIKCSKTNLHFEIELFVLIKDECVYLKPKHRQGDVALFRRTIQSLIIIINNKIINNN